MKLIKFCCIFQIFFNPVVWANPIDQISRQISRENSLQIHKSISDQQRNESVSKSVKSKKLAPKDKIKLIQTLLTDQGYQPGGIDGLFGRKTSKAIMKYQQDKGLSIDGKVSDSLIESMSE